MKIFQLWNGIKIGIWAIKHPNVLGINAFEMLSDLLTLLLKVATEDRHYMTDIVINIKGKNVNQPIVHVWAGAGITAEPIKRIKELIEENKALKDSMNQSNTKEAITEP